MGVTKSFNVAKSDVVSFFLVALKYLTGGGGLGEGGSGWAVGEFICA